MTEPHTPAFTKLTGVSNKSKYSLYSVNSLILYFYPLTVPSDSL